MSKLLLWRCEPLSIGRYWRPGRAVALYSEPSRCGAVWTRAMWRV